jgi:hypothetical protein
MALTQHIGCPCRLAAVGGTAVSGAGRVHTPMRPVYVHETVPSHLGVVAMLVGAL